VVAPGNRQAGSSATSVPPPVPGTPGRRHDEHQQPWNIGREVPFACGPSPASRRHAPGGNPGAFGDALTGCASMSAAVGRIRRPCFARSRSRGVSWICSAVPSRSRP
jgi:hypothetical protein